MSLAEGERLTDVTLKVWKYGAIAGTVVDEAGEPVVGVAVRALIKDVFAGRPRYGTTQVISELVPIATTDDRGMFRLSQLMPGTYVVLVPSTQTTVPASFVERSDSELRSDLFFAGVPEVSLLGQPRTQQAGDFALLTLNRVLIPPPPSPAGRMAVYPTTYFPAAATAGAATPIPVESRRRANGHHDRGAARAGGTRVRPPRDAGRSGSAADHHQAARRRDDRRHYDRAWPAGRTTSAWTPSPA